MYSQHKKCEFLKMVQFLSLKNTCATIYFSLLFVQICYDLASEGVVVVAVEHRDGSASNSLFFQDGSIEEVSYW